MTHTSRISVVLDAKDKQLLSHAACLVETTVSDFVRKATIEKAQAVLELNDRLSFSSQDFAELRSCIAESFNPNKSLRMALWRAGSVHRN